MATQVKYIPAHSVVKLPDGRVGRLCDPERNRPTVLLPGRQLGVSVKRSDLLEIVFYPAEIVQNYLDANYPHVQA